MRLPARRWQGCGVGRAALCLAAALILGLDFEEYGKVLVEQVAIKKTTIMMCDKKFGDF